MPELIEDGKGRGFKAGVDSDNRLLVQAHIEDFQHHIAKHDEGTFQIIGTATPTSGTTTVLHLTNTDTTSKTLSVTYIRVQNVGLTGGTAVPNTSNYFSIGMNQSYVSGGSAATAVNLSGDSSVTANISGYQGDPTLSGTFSEIDRWYPDGDGKMQIFAKQGSLVLPPGSSMGIKYVGDHSTGLVYARISFVMESEDE